jgi:hypothetical protein
MAAPCANFGAATGAARLLQARAAAMIAANVMETMAASPRISLTMVRAT